MSTFLFYLGFATLIAHEMDAIAQSEWKLLYILRKLPEQTAAPLFVAMHVPLLTLLMWLTGSHTSYLQQGSRIAIALFLIIHTAIHRRLEHHPLYTFHSKLSKSLIYSGGILGGLYLMLLP